VDHTNVTDEGLKYVAAMKNLKILHLFGTSVSPAAVKKLRAERPGLEVVEPRR